MACRDDTTQATPTEESDRAV